MSDTTSHAKNFLVELRILDRFNPKTNERHLSSFVKGGISERSISILHSFVILREKERMVRVKFFAQWLPVEHAQFWVLIDQNETIEDVMKFFIEQEKSLAEFYHFDLPKRSTKVKYLKALIDQCVLPPHGQTLDYLRENDSIEFRLETNGKDHWMQIQSAPSLKRKHSEEKDLDVVLRTLAEPSPKKSSIDFQFQFGNKRGRPIPPRPAVMSSTKINSFIPLQVLKKKN